MTNTVQCACGKKLISQVDLAGKAVQCPSCAAVIVVPASAPVAVAAAMILITCSCGTQLQAPAHLEGKPVRCSTCQSVLTVVLPVAHAFVAGMPKATVPAPAPAPAPAPSPRNVLFLILLLGVPLLLVALGFGVSGLMFGWFADPPPVVAPPKVSAAAEHRPRFATAGTAPPAAPPSVSLHADLIPQSGTFTSFRFSAFAWSLEENLRLHPLGAKICTTLDRLDLKPAGVWRLSFWEHKSDELAFVQVGHVIAEDELRAQPGTIEKTHRGRRFFQRGHDCIYLPPSVNQTTSIILGSEATLRSYFDLNPNELGTSAEVRKAIEGNGYLSLVVNDFEAYFRKHRPKAWTGDWDFVPHVQRFSVIFWGSEGHTNVNAIFKFADPAAARASAEANQLRDTMVAALPPRKNLKGSDLTPKVLRSFELAGIVTMGKFKSVGSELEYVNHISVPLFKAIDLLTALELTSPNRTPLLLPVPRPRPTPAADAPPEILAKELGRQDSKYAGKRVIIHGVASYDARAEKRELTIDGSLVCKKVPELGLEAADSFVNKQVVVEGTLQPKLPGVLHPSLVKCELISLCNRKKLYDDLEKRGASFFVPRGSATARLRLLDNHVEKPRDFVEITELLEQYDGDLAISFGGRIIPPYKANLIREFRNVTEAEFNRNLFPDDLAALSNFVNLRRLEFSSLSLSWTKYDLSRLANFPHLESFQLGGIMENEPLAPLAKLSKLKHLNLRGNNVDARALGYLVELKNLESLSGGILEKNWSDETPRRLLRMPGMKFSQRTSIEFSVGPHFTPQGIAELSACAELAALNIDCQSGGSFSDETLREISKLKTLKRLWLTEPRAGAPQATRVTPAGLAVLKDLPDLALLYLRLDGDLNAGMVHLNEIPHLKSLSLDSCISDDALDVIAQMTGLEHLSFCNCKNLTDAGLAKLKGLKRLATLQLLGTPNVTVEGRDVLRKSLPQIRFQTVIPVRPKV